MFALYKHARRTPPSNRGIQCKIGCSKKAFKVSAGVVGALSFDPDTAGTRFLARAIKDIWCSPTRFVSMLSLIIDTAFDVMLASALPGFCFRREPLEPALCMLQRWRCNPVSRIHPPSKDTRSAF